MCLEAVSRGLDVPKLTQAIRDVPGVRDVHDLHIWCVTSGFCGV
jgi:cobalt-zinc-cadmium efflux system protein